MPYAAKSAPRQITVEMRLYLCLVIAGAIPACEQNAATKGDPNSDAAASSSEDAFGGLTNDGGRDGTICRTFAFAKKDFVSRTGYNWADSWMMSWAADGKTYTSFSDGKVSVEAPKVTNAILTIDDDLPNLTAASFRTVSEDAMGVGMRNTWSHYNISTIFVGDTLYVGMVDFSYNGGIARSDDGGRTLQYDRSRPMWPGSAVTRFVYPSFLQNGRGYEGNTDGYMYVYGTDGRWGETNALRVARIPKTADFRDVTQYQYYDGSGWSASLDKALNVLGPSAELGGMQSIVFNPHFNRYFLITFSNPGNVGGPAHMTVFDAPDPWGPFFECGVISRKDALFKEVPGILHEIYNPSFNAKWIDEDGGMWISYSSCCEDSQYTFQYGKISVER